MYIIIISGFSSFRGCPCFKPVHSELSMLFWSAAPSHSLEPWDYFQTMPGTNKSVSILRTPPTNFLLFWLAFYK